MKRILDLQFFNNLWGFEESTENIKNLIAIHKESDGNCIIESLVDGKKLRSGIFEIRTVKSLFGHNIKPRHGVFNIIIGNGPSTTNFSKIDIGALQANPENRGATFQVASNFNCLELISIKDSPSKGITKYVHDQTQGPAASISAAPGTLFRNYFVEHMVDNIMYKGQLNKQINLLDNFPYIPVINGYISFKDNEVQCLEDMGILFNEDLMNDIKVGIQKNVQVTSGQKRGGYIDICTNEQTINQVFTAAMNLGGVSAKYSQHPIIENLACFLLKGAYKATIGAAIENSISQPSNMIGKNKLFLTLIGGGVFGNKCEWIVDAIFECKELIKNSGLEVYLVIYASYTIDEESLVRLFCLVEETKGKKEILQ